MPTALTTRIISGLGATVKNAPLNNNEIDNNFISLNTNKLEASNNLSEITNALAARSNLGLVIGTHVQPHDANLDSIVGLTGTSGFLKKTASNTWSLDTNTYLTATSNVNTQVASLAISGTATQNGYTGGIVPIGGIIMWSGSPSNVPSGWSICNGTNGTPNLSNRFIVSVGSSYSVGATGGSADATLVSHNHGADSTVFDPGHTHSHTDANGASTYQVWDGDLDGSTRATGYDKVTLPFSINSATTGITVETGIHFEGSSATNANLPPYYALAFIMRIS